MKGGCKASTLLCKMCKDLKAVLVQTDPIIHVRRSLSGFLLGDGV